MWNLRRLCFALGIIWMSGAMTPRVQAQEIADTMRITIRGDLARTEIVRAEVFVQDLRIGQQGVLVAQAYDSDGDPVEADFFWESMAPDTLAIEVTSDSTATVTALHKAPAGVIVKLTATEKTRVVIAAWRSADGKFLGIDQFTLQCAALPDGTLSYTVIEEPELRAEAAGWCSAQLCAYAVKEERMVLQSALPPECPLLFGAGNPGRPLSSRVVPFAALQASLRPG